MKKAIICFPEVGSSVVQCPTGLYKIATHCKEKYDVLILDQRIEEDLFGEIDRIIDENNEILCLGLSVMTGEQIKNALDISKRYFGKLKIVWGGIHPTILPEQTIKNEFVDYVLIGEGEEAFLNLLMFLDGQSINEQMFLSKSNLNYTFNYYKKFEDTEYFDLNKYKIRKEYLVKRDGFENAFTLETSRGCPHKCYFCHNIIYNRPYRCLSYSKVAEIINYLVENYQIDGIIFQEDNFFVKSERVRKIMEYFIDNKNLGWKANSRINYFNSLIRDSDFMENLVKSKCKVLQFGIESGSDKVIEMINKNINLKEVLEINKEFSYYPINIRYNFIIGFPGESIEDMEKTFELIEILQDQNKNVEPPFLNIYNPYPGTPLFKYAVALGFKEAQSLEEWSKFNWNKVNFGWLPNNTQKYMEKKSCEYFEKSRYLK